MFIFLADVHESDLFKFSIFRVLSHCHLWTTEKLSESPYLVQRLTWLDFCIVYVQRDMAYVYVAFSFPNAFLTGCIHSRNVKRNEWKNPTFKQFFNHFSIIRLETCFCSVYLANFFHWLTLLAIQTWQMPFPCFIFRRNLFSLEHNHPLYFHKFKSLSEIILLYFTIFLLGFTALTLS